jgi:hypothetical protein
MDQVGDQRRRVARPFDQHRAWPALGDQPLQVPGAGRAMVADGEQQDVSY